MDMARLRHYQKAYRALIAAIGMSDDQRRAFNIDMTGHYGSSDFDEQAWLLVIGRLQELNGQDAQPGQPRLKLPRKQHEDDMEQAFLSEGLGYDAPSDAQLRFIRSLAERIAWRVPNGLEALIRKCVLREGGGAERLWRGTLETLTREDAGLTIRILLRMAGGKKQPRQEAHAAAV
jgi:hypothetical protein